MTNNSGVYIVVDGKLRLISSSAITVNNISPDKDKNITLTKDDIGLDKVGNYSIASTVDAQNGVSDEKYMTPKSTKVAIKYNLQNIEDKVDSHLKDKNNPHNVTAEQIGAVTSVNGIEQVDGNVDLGNLVKSVNSKAADDKGNVDLGELATPTDVSNSKIEAVTEAKNYTDSKIESLEFNGVKSVNNKLPDLEGNVDLGELATPDDIQQANEDTLNKAKAYTDEAIGNIDLSEMEQQLNEHSSKIATENELGHIRVGKNMKIDDSGVLSVKVASKETIESGVFNDEFITPKGLEESKEAIIKSVVDIEKYDKHLEKIASKDELGHFKVGRGLSITEDGVLSVPTAPIIYGIEIDEDNSDPFGRVKYIADSTGFEPLYTGDGNVDLGSWGDKFPINKVKVVLMKDGEVVEELDENDYTKTVDGRTVDITSGDNGDVMVGIPLTFWKFERVGSNLRIYVSDKQVDFGFKAYAHSRDGVVQDDYLYIGAYKGNVQDDKLRSLHDVMSTGDKTIGEFRTYAENNGEGYSQQYWGAMTLMQIFTVLLTKSTDSQSVLGRGYVDGNSDFIKNGGTTKKGLFYGEATGKEQMKFLGIEDFWGNRYEWVDGVATDSNRMWLINDKNTDYNDAGDNYTKHGECFDSSGYISQVDGKTNTGFIPVKTNGSSSTYYADRGAQSNWGGRVADFGGDFSNGSNVGAFRLNVLNSASDSNTYRSARLIYLKGGN